MTDTELTLILPLHNLFEVEIECIINSVSGNLATGICVIWGPPVTVWMLTQDWLDTGSD